MMAVPFIALYQALKPFRNLVAAGAIQRLNEMEAYQTIQPVGSCTSFSAMAGGPS